jgi:AraC family transcriptional regulator
MGEMAQACASSFSVQETHGILLRPENQVHAASDRLGWTSLYASTQREAPYESEFAGVPDHLIILHLDGPVGVSRALGKSRSHRVIGPGGLFMLPGGMDFGVRLEGYLDSLHIYLRRQIIEEVALDFGLERQSVLELAPRFGDHDPLIERMALGVRDALGDGDPASGMYVDYLARMMAAHLLRKHTVSAPAWAPASPGALTKAQVERAIDYMEANLGDSIALSDVAAASGLSPSHFARRFKSAMGMPPHQYLMFMRVERAKHLLRQREPIVEVALVCGFTHQEHLTRVFRRFTGATPAGYRKASLS